MIRIVINTKQDIRIRVNICNSFNIVCHFHELAIWKNRVCGWEKRDRAKGKCFALSMFSLLLDWIQSHCQLYNCVCVCVFSTPVVYIVHPDFICVIERVSSHWMRTPISLCLQTFPACSESVVCVCSRVEQFRKLVRESRFHSLRAFSIIISDMGLFCYCSFSSFLVHDAGIFLFHVLRKSAVSNNITTAMNAYFYLILFFCVGPERFSCDSKCMKWASYYYYRL